VDVLGLLSTVNSISYSCCYNLKSDYASWNRSIIDKILTSEKCKEAVSSIGQLTIGKRSPVV
jgi:hypothetical protein